jgi:hypothetical protein
MRLEQDVLIGGRTVSTGWWLRNPNNVALDGPSAETFFAAYFATVMPDLLGLMHDESMLTTCRLRGQAFHAESNAPPNVGAWSGATEIVVASGLKWITKEARRASWSLSYVPACPSAFISDHWQLNSTGYGTLRAQGLAMLFSFNALPAPIAGVQELGTVQRKSASGPLPASRWVGYADVYPVTKLVTCRRRLPKRGPVLPL